MYTPRANVERDISTLRQFVRANPLCALITGTPQGLVASHVPVVLHEEGAGFGILRGHVARANSQWQGFDPKAEALAIFTDSNEMTMEVPWKVSDAPRDFILKKFRRIVGLEMEVSRVEGKWNVTQSRSEEDAHGVIAGLERLATPASETMSNLIRTQRSNPSTK